MPSVDLSTEAYVHARPEQLAPALTNAALLHDWFPDVQFEVFMDRGSKGTRWSVQGDLAGSMEVWLEPVGTGTLVHWFVRGEPSGSGRDFSRRCVQLLNARMFTFKDEAEQARLRP